MDEQIITTQNGMKYGRFQVTLPMYAKQRITKLIKLSGMRKAEFLRIALLIGATQLINDTQVGNTNEDFSQLSLE